MIDWDVVRQWVGPVTGVLALIVSVVGLVRSARAGRKAATASETAATAAASAADAQQRIAAVVEAQSAPPPDAVVWRVEYKSVGHGTSPHVHVLRNVGTIAAADVTVEKHPDDFPSRLDVAGREAVSLRPGEGVEFFIWNSMNGKLQQVKVAWRDSAFDEPREDVLRLA